MNRMTIDDWYSDEGNYAGRELSLWKQLLSMASVYHLALLSKNNYLLTVVSQVCAITVHATVQILRGPADK
jgi:hypothetical protein